MDEQDSTPDDWFYTQPSAGYWLVPAVGDAANDRAFRHTFCGQHDLRGGHCPVCDKPLLRFLELDARDPRIEVDSSRFRSIPLLYCWTCEVGRDVFSYRIVADDIIEIVHMYRGERQKDFPYEEYPTFFDTADVWLSPISVEDQSIIRTQNRPNDDDWSIFKLRGWLTHPNHQIGGEPLLLQGLDDFRPRCPVCKDWMPHLACIGNASLAPKGFVDCDYVQVLFSLCRACGIVSAVNRTD